MAEMMFNALTTFYTVVLSALLRFETARRRVFYECECEGRYGIQGQADGGEP